MSHIFTSRLKDVFDTAPNIGKRRKRSARTTFHENNVVEHVLARSNVRIKRQTDFDGLKTFPSSDSGSAMDKIKSAIARGMDTAKTMAQNFKKLADGF